MVEPPISLIVSAFVVIESGNVLILASEEELRCGDSHKFNMSIFVYYAVLNPRGC